MLVAPTELRHAVFRALTREDRGSNVPEAHGVDFMFIARGRKYGVQRKEMKDFVASVHDGRLAKEIAQMSALERGLLVIEGTPKWSLDGELLTSGFTQRWTRSSHDAYLFSVQSAGVWYATSQDTRETAVVVMNFEHWAKKEKHRALENTRGAAPNPWGTRTRRDWQRHLLMGFEGVGIETADAIIDVFGGVPLKLTVAEEDLLRVKGIGPKTARKIMEAL